MSEGMVRFVEVVSKCEYSSGAENDIALLYIFVAFVENKNMQTSYKFSHD